MGLGAAMAGGNPAAGREDDDFYPTPPECTVALLKRFRFGDGTLIHEPACGNMAMVEVIQRFGYEVVASDLVKRHDNTIEQDFLTLEKPMAKVVITNPPFKLAAAFIEHGMGTLKLDAMALVLKSTFWHASSRLKLFNRYPPVVEAPLTWRPDFLGKGRPTMDCTWFIFRRGHSGHPAVIPLVKPDVSRKASAIS